jgi:hypothetical protein
MQHLKARHASPINIINCLEAIVAGVTALSPRPKRYYFVTIQVFRIQESEFRINTGNGWHKVLTYLQDNGLL